MHTYTHMNFAERSNFKKPGKHQAAHLTFLLKSNISILWIIALHVTN